MPLKQKNRFLLSAATVVSTSLVSGLVVYFAAVHHTSQMVESSAAELGLKIDSAQEFDVERFESRVESALESIVSKRNASRAASAKAATKASSNLSMNDKGQVVYGNPDADLTIYTFSDFRCSYCTRFDPLVQSFVDQSGGEVNFIYKPYPVLGPASVSLAQAGECVAQEEGPEAFWRYSEMAYKTKNWITAISQSQLSDVQNIRTCVEQNRYGKRITRSLDEGEELNITGTPSSVFRNNITGQGAFIPGYIETNQISQMLEEIK
jgi:protein-disulfide isomerase